MKHFILLLYLGAFLNMPLKGQYYEKKYLPFYFQEAENVLMVNDSTTVVLIGTRTQNEYHYESGLLFIDKHGEIIDSVHYQQDSTNYYSTALLANEQGYAIAVAKDLDTHGYSQYHDNMYFVQTDPNGQILYQHPIGYPGNTNSNDLMSMIRTPEDGGYLLVGWLSLPFGAYYRPYLVKLNSSGEKQWEKIINDYDPTQDNLFWDIARTPNGEYYAAGVNILVEDEVAKILLAKIDPTNGNIIEDWNYDLDAISPNNQSYCGGMKLMSLDDGGLLIGAQNDIIPRTGALLRLDSNKTVVWVNHEVLNDCGPRKLLYLPTDGSFVTTGCATVLYPAVSDGVQVEISKVSATGSLLWKRHYGTDHADDYAWDMVSTPDGGFMVVGRSYSIFWQQTPIYLLKTNCMGLLTLPQANFTVAMDTAALRASFYNTSQYIYPDSIDGGRYLWQFGDGSTSTEQNPTHTYAQGGNYTVTLTAVVCSDTSVFVQTVSTWAVGNELVSANNLVKVFPNPANSYLTVVTTNATQGGNLVLYDMLGQAVKQATLSKTNTSINVSDLCAGVYLYEVFNSYSSSKQKVTYGKVNVLH